MSTLDKMVISIEKKMDQIEKLFKPLLSITKWKRKWL